MRADSAIACVRLDEGTGLVAIHQRLQAQVLAQAQEQLGWHGLTALRTVIDKRATFSCLPLLHRPGLSLGHGLWACGDYLQGPYPATIEGAVRSGIQAAQAIAAAHRA